MIIIILKLKISEMYNEIFTNDRFLNWLSINLMKFDISKKVEINLIIKKKKLFQKDNKMIFLNYDIWL